MVFSTSPEYVFTFIVTASVVNDEVLMLRYLRTE